MCRNHSHAAVDNMALAPGTNPPMLMIHFSQAVSLEIPDGTRLTMPSNSTCYVPLSIAGDSYPWPPPEMVEQFAFMLKVADLFSTAAATGGDE